jgi:hypothetical protein
MDLWEAISLVVEAMKTSWSRGVTSFNSAHEASGVLCQRLDEFKAVISVSGRDRKKVVGALALIAADAIRGMTNTRNLVDGEGPEKGM